MGHKTVTDLKTNNHKSQENHKTDSPIAAAPIPSSDWEVQPFCLFLGNFRTLTNFKYPLFFSSKIGITKR